MMEVNGVRKVTQWEAKEVEGAGLITYDFLCITNLIDLEGALKLINRKNGNDGLEPGWFYHNGVKTFIWDLPKEDQKTYEMICRGELATLFQESTKAMYPFVTAIKPKSIMDHATILALVRPGPLDFIDEKTGLSMAQEYIERRQGRGTYEPGDELVKLLPETYGIIVFQEQLTKVARNLAGMSGERAEILRENMCKKKLKELMLMKPDFMEGAKKQISEEAAELIWKKMETFGQYGFSIIHAVGYAMITYATAFLKAHYPLEWWSSILSNSDTKEINEKYWKHVRHLIAPPDINKSGYEMIIDYDTGKIRSKLTMVKGLAGGAQKIIDKRPFASIQDFARRCDLSASMTRKLMAVGVMDSLFKNGETLIEKIQAYEDELELIKHEEKLAEYPAKLKAYEEKKARGERATKPAEPKLKRGKVDPDYLSMGPIDMFALKKGILPSMPISLTDLVIDLGMVEQTHYGKGMVDHPEYKGKKLPLLDGETVAAVEQQIVEKFTIVPCVGYVVEAKEHTFKKDASKKFLKMIIDTDNHLRELVMWPDYDTGQLEYPFGLAEGAVGIFYLSKRAGKPDASVNAVKLLKLGKIKQEKEA
jgi:DNA polymerase III alpha subunit